MVGIIVVFARLTAVCRLTARYCLKRGCLWGLREIWKIKVSRRPIILGRWKWQFRNFFGPPKTHFVSLAGLPSERKFTMQRVMLLICFAHAHTAGAPQRAMALFLPCGAHSPSTCLLVGNLPATCSQLAAHLTPPKIYRAAAAPTRSEKGRIRKSRGVYHLKINMREPKAPRPARAKRWRGCEMAFSSDFGQVAQLR